MSRDLGLFLCLNLPHAAHPWRPFYSSAAMLPTLSVKSNVAGLAARIGVEAKDIPKRTATALTWTAKEVRDGLRAEMKRVFERPNPYTLSSLYLKPATARDLTALVWFKDKHILSKQHYLEPQIFGGARVLKPFEERLRRIGLLTPGWYAVPGRAARFDAYGNMSRGQLVQILSQLRAIGLAGQGSDAQPTNSPRSRRNLKRAGQYFVGRPGNGRLPPGVYLRRKDTVLPVLIFVKGVLYQKRFDFYGVAERISQREFPLQFAKAAAQAAARKALNP